MKVDVVAGPISLATPALVEVPAAQNEGHTEHRDHGLPWPVRAVSVPSLHEALRVLGQDRA